MVTALDRLLDGLPLESQLQVLFAMLDDVLAGRDATLAALREHAELARAKPVIIGGIAVIRHGYKRTTTDRDLLVDYRSIHLLAERLMNDPDWERLEVRQYCFVYRPTGIQVGFLVSRDLAQLGRPYQFPDVKDVETGESVGGLPVIGLHDLLWLKLLAGRARDTSDMMELCKLHLAEIDPQRVVARVEAEDDDLRQRWLGILRQVPIELENERRFREGTGPGAVPPAE